MQVDLTHDIRTSYREPPHVHRWRLNVGTWRCEICKFAAHAVRA